tara:strand:+ start:1527 stop:1760 length:234 start_codon:yes stop_codon:yes gene_type:complete
MRKLAPHAAIVNIQVITNISPLLITGEVSGDNISPDELKQYGMKINNMFQVTGKDTVECMKNLKNKMDKISKVLRDE